MKKRSIRACVRAGTITIILVLVLSLFGFTASAATNTVVSVSVSNQSLSPGQQFTVNVIVQPNSALAGIQFSLSYDPTLVSVINVTEGNLLRQGGASTYFVPGKIDSTAGTLSNVVSVITTPGQKVSTTGTLAVIAMTAGAKSGTCPITLSDIIIGDINGQPVSTSVVDGQVITNRAPILSAIGDKTVDSGSQLSFVISATDPDGNPLTYSASNLPSGATFNTSNRTFSWTPSASQAGIYTNVHFQVSDGRLTDYENITINVTLRKSTATLTVLTTTVTIPGVVSFKFSGFQPNSSVIIQIDGVMVTAVRSGTSGSGLAGAYLASGTTGVHTIVAVDRYGHSANSTFIIK